MEKGFENTSVDDIVGRMNVAKGLFYYYFDSKEDLLAAISERLVDEIQSSIAAAMERKGLTAVQRLGELMPSNTDISSRSRMLIAYFHKERNQAFHHLMEKRGREFMVPAMELIIRQGNEEEVFDTKYPHETAMAIVAMFGAFKDYRPSAPSTEQLIRIADFAQQLMERVLGAKPGTLGMLKERLAPTGCTGSARPADSLQRC